MDAFIRRMADSAYHPACSCRMGLNPHPSVSKGGPGYIGNGRIGAAVVKPNCSVWGIEGLRVVDTSIMPSSVSGNLNAPVMMMAEKASAMILEESEGEHDLSLPPATGAKVWTPKFPLLQRDGCKK